MERRSFLLGTSTLALSQLLVGCGNNKQVTLNVELLKGSIPAQVVNQFSRLQPKMQLKFTPVEQLQDLFQQLQTWQKKTNTTDEEGLRRFLPFAKSQKVTKADLVTLGDYWISYAIEKKLIQPLDVIKIQQWSALPKKWQELVTRNEKGLVDPKGNVWAVPYRWGSTVIIYRQDKFQELGLTPPRDWSDLWNEKLQGRISLLNQPREVIGLVLKKLGKSYNTENLDTVPNLEKELQLLNQQVKFYDSTRYLEPLIIGDTLLAVGWSNDIAQFLGRYPQLATVVPQSGTALSADVWVTPTGQNRQSLLYEWIDFCLKPDVAKKICLLTKTNSPIPTNIAESDFQKPLSSLLVINPEVFEKSEFLLPLSQQIMAQYESFFAKMKG